MELWLTAEIGNHHHGRSYAKHTQNPFRSAQVKCETETQTSGPPTMSIFPTLLPHAVTRLTLKNRKIINIEQLLKINITLGAKLTHLGWSQSGDQLIKNKLNHRQILVCNVNHRQMLQSQPTRLLSQMSQLYQKFQLKQ